MNLFPHPDETIIGLSSGIRSRHVSCEQIVTRCLERIDAAESRIRAWVLIDRDGALSTARELDAELEGGRWRGPLHGVPIGIKDIIDVAGWPTAAGSGRWRNLLASQDATLVARLKDAGAILLGKTVTTQYASFDPPATRNPWNVARTPGGSSSGSAAAVAMGMCLAAIGSQTGGSITRPASYCGVAGMKPSFGRVSVRGVLPLAPSMDHPGPLARCVDDLAIVYHTLAGYDPEDPDSIDAATEDAERDNPDASSPPRLGRLGGLFEQLATPDVRQSFASAVKTLAAAGACVQDPPLPAEFDDVLVSHRLVMAVEAAAVHEERIARHPEEYGPCITQLIGEGLETAATQYARARRHQVASKRTILRSFADCDVLICPATTDPAPDAATTGNPAFNSPWSYTGLPTVSFPTGLSADGLPLSVQLVGPPLGERALLRAARWCARVIRAADT